MSNVVLVKKESGKWSMCLDYTYLNKACLKDSYLFPIIGKLVDNSIGYKLLSFVDAYFKHKGITMHKLEMNKTLFMRKHINYRYNVIPFGLENKGVTYQKRVIKIFEEEINRMLEVYMDDLISKSTK